MAADPVLERVRCETHPDRQAVGRCGSCRRSVCLECAVPFRGDVRCGACAAREAGVPAPPTPAPVSRRPEAVTAIVLALALLTTVPPWHRSGTLTGVLSAWRPGLGTSSFVATLSIAVAAAASTAVAIGGLAPSRGLAASIGGLAAVGAGASAVAIVGAPDFFSPTPAPFLTIGLALAAAVAEAWRARGLRRAS